MRILVTGGAGYIGSVVADQLLRARHTVTVLDNLIMGWREAVPAAAEFVQADTGDEATLNQLFTSHTFDAVMHFAALIEAGESVKVPEQYFDNNSLRSLTLLRVMLKHRVSRFVFSSTAAVYGEPKTIPIPEDHPLSPTNAYGESKLIVELFFDALPVKQRTETIQDIAEHGSPPYAIPSTWAIAAVSFSHASFSSSSCRRPFLVSS